MFGSNFRKWSEMSVTHLANERRVHVNLLDKPNRSLYRPPLSAT